MKRPYELMFEDDGYFDMAVIRKSYSGLAYEKERESNNDFQGKYPNWAVAEGKMKESEC